MEIFVLKPFVVGKLGREAKVNENLKKYLDVECVRIDNW